jgi:hypothetical protein
LVHDCRGLKHHLWVFSKYDEKSLIDGWLAIELGFNRRWSYIVFDRVFQALTATKDMEICLKTDSWLMIFLGLHYI